MKKQKIGQYLSLIGFIIFMLLFWLPFGFELGGDPYFGDVYDTRLKIIFPYGGIGIFLLFVGAFLEGRFKTITENHLLYFLFFLIGIGVISNFSTVPQISVLFLIIWAIGFFGSVLGNTFYLNTPQKQYITVFGITIGLITSYYFPEWGISYDLLAIVSIYLLAFMLTSKVPALWWLVWVSFFTIALSQNWGLIIFTVLLWGTAPWWYTRRRKNTFRLKHWLPLLFFVIFSIWKYKNHIHNTEAFDFNFFTTWHHLFVGVGAGQFIPEAYQQASFYFLKSVPEFPTSGLWHTFIEQGIFGIVLITFIAVYPIILNRTKNILPTFLFLCFWILSSYFLGTVNGILLGMMFLFAQRKNK